MPKRCEVILYPEDGWDEQKILQVISGRRTVKEYAFILHDQDREENGEAKKAHYHIYLNFGKCNDSFAHVAAWFAISPNHVNRIKGSQYAVLSYYTHKNYPDKHQYSVDKFVASFDVGEYLDSFDRKKSVENILKQCADGTVTPHNYDVYIDPVTYARYETQIRRAFEYADHQRDIADNGRRTCGTVWVYGAAGVGKTTLCQLFAEQKQLPMYKTATGRDPFSHYVGQPVLVLDDLRANEQFSYAELLKTIDPYYICPVQSRYRNKVLRCTNIFITSVLAPWEVVAAYDLGEHDSGAQLYRRISEIWHVRKDDIVIYKYDMERGQFARQTIIPNPVPDYLALQDTPPAVVDGAAVLGQITTKYQRQLMLEDC